MIEFARKELTRLTKEQKQSEYEAWNSCSTTLVSVSKVYMNIFVIMSNLTYVHSHATEYGRNVSNTEALMNLFELYLLYGITQTYTPLFMKFNPIDSSTLKIYETRIFQLLPLIRTNAVLLLDAIDWTDSTLCSSLGSYDGNAYERLLDYARNSQMNAQDPVEQFEKYLKPFVERQQQEKSKL